MFNKRSDPSAVVQERRKMLLGMPALAVATIGGGALIGAPLPAYAAGVHSMISVGDGGDFATLDQAVLAVQDATASNQYQILLLPGIHVVSVKISVPDYVHVRGVDRMASVIYMSARWAHLEVSRTCSFSNFTVINDPAYDVRFCFRVRYPAVGNYENILLFEGVDFNINGTPGACITVNSPVALHMRNCNLFTSGVGLKLLGRCFAYIYDTNISITGSSTGAEKICIDAINAGRVFIFGGKYGTGYGSPEISNDPGVDFIGFKVGTVNRMQVFNAWMIIRQDAVGATGLSYAVKMTAPGGWIRLCGGYYQAEMNDYGKTAAGIDIDNSIGATVEIYPDTRVRAAFTLGDTVGFTGATGVSNLVAGQYRYVVGKGGIKKCNTSSGDILILLEGDGFVSGEEFLFVRTAGTGTITIRSNKGTLINGQSEVSVGPNLYQKLSIRRVDNEFIAY